MASKCTVFHFVVQYNQLVDNHFKLSDCVVSDWYYRNRP